MIAMRVRLAILAALAFAACAKDARRSPTSAGTAAGSKAALGVAAMASDRELVTPARLVPDIDADEVAPGFVEAGARLYLLGGVRARVLDDGRVERAVERFGSAAVTAQALPERLLGGWLFHVSDSRGTRLWRADTFTGSLRPLAAIARPSEEIIAGFDRLYLRGRLNSIVAIDANDGSLRPLGPLPAASSLGAMAFADGWRAVVSADLRGPLATFDAGESWRPLAIAATVRSVTVSAGDPLVLSDQGAYRLAADGSLELVRDSDGGGAATDEEDDARDASPRKASPLGKHALRRAVEHGYPDGPSSAVVAYEGALVRVSLPDGKILAHAREAYEGRAASCHGVRLGTGFGFVCGAPAGTTTIYAYKAPLSLAPVLEFSRPRFVASSHNGALVVRGSCDDKHSAYDEPTWDASPAPPEDSDAAALRDDGSTDGKAAGAEPSSAKSSSAKPAAGRGPHVPAGKSAPEPATAAKTSSKGNSGERAARSYCVLGVDGSRREVVVRGDLGSERVVALTDGRTAILIPPRFGAPPTLSLVTGNDVKSIALSYPDDTSPATKLAQRGVWLEGFFQRDPKSLAGWIEARGRVVGVTVGLDGKLSFGEVYDRGGDVLVSGPYALAMPASEVGFESHDGGATFRRFELPKLPESARDGRTRGCSAVGCALRGWVRIGWGGDTEKEMPTAPAPEEREASIAVEPSVELACRFVPSARKPGTPAPEASGEGVVDEGSAWSAFRGQPPPHLGKAEVGVDKGTLGYSLVSAHGYVWGPTGADWTRTGSWLMRFDDRFDPSGRVRATHATRPPWGDADSAAAALGARRHMGYWRWNALLDSAGTAALVSVCQGGVAPCELFSAVEGRPVVRIPTMPYLRRPADAGAVRVGDAWYFIVDGGSSGIELYRADGMGVRLVAMHARVTGTANQPLASVSLVRRAAGDRLALLVTAPADEGGAELGARWSLLPVELSDGSLGEPLRIDANLLAPPLAPCDPRADGWVLELTPTAATAVRIVGVDGYLDQFEYRMRVDSGHACVEAIAARASRPVEAAGTTFEPPASAKLVPLAASESYGETRWRFDCYDTR